MRAIKMSVFIGLILSTNSYYAQCKPYFGPNNGKPVQVVFEHRSGECFKLEVNNEEINSDFASSVSFYTTVETSKRVTVTMENGSKKSKTIYIPNQLATAYYKITKSDDGEYSIKLQLLRGEITEEEKQKREDEEWRREQQRKEDKEKSDREWNAKIARQKEWMRNEMDRDPKYSIKKTDTDIKKVEINNGKATEHTDGNVPASNNNILRVEGNGSDQAATKGATAIKVIMLYKSKPIANTFITFKTPEGNVVASGTTDASGKLTMYTNFKHGLVNIDVFGERGDYRWNISGLYTYKVGNPVSGHEDFDLYSGIELVSQVMNMDVSTLAKSWGMED